MHCSVVPPGVVYIGKATNQNEFTLHFRKVPLHLPTAKPDFRRPQCRAVPPAPDGEAVIYLYPELAPEPNPTPDPKYLCTRRQAANTTFTRTAGAPGWTMDWLDAYDCFVVRPPVAFSFQEAYEVSFRSAGFATDELQGVSTLTVYGMGFPDMGDFAMTVELTKLLPVVIISFSANQERVEAGSKVTLTWETQNAGHCWISGVGNVETSGSRSVKMDVSTVFMLAAENNFGYSEYAQCKVDVLSTPWRCCGEVSGLEFSTDSGNLDRRIWAWHGAQYVFERGDLWKSADGLVWRALSSPDLSAGFQLKRWCTMIFQDEFYVLGGTREGETGTWAFLYDLAAGSWRMQKLLPDRTGTDGVLTAVNGVPLYAFLMQGGLIAYTPTGFSFDESWGPRFFFPAPGAGAMDFTAWNDRMLCAVRNQSDGCISFFSASVTDGKWKPFQCSLPSVSSAWFRLLTAGQHAWLLEQNKLWRLDCFRAASDYQPPFTKQPPWCGMIDLDLFALPDGKALWRYENG